jgi:hypothetical protein
MYVAFQATMWSGIGIAMYALEIAFLGDLKPQKIKAFRVVTVWSGMHGTSSQHGALL